MDGVTKFFALALTAVSSAVILVIAFAWVGPGLDGLSSSASADLFDEQVVEGIYDQVSPAVVDIRIDRSSGNSFTQIGSGSGFLIDSEGHIATNNHVVESADRLRVAFHDGKEVEAQALGRSTANDLALLKVDPSVVAGIKPVTLGDSALARPGQLAVAIGSPFGLSGSVTVGIISGVDRDLPTDLGRPISGVLQTDALINPGNSGGPLLNSKGEVVGINTAIQVTQNTLSSSAISRQSIGFAVPINSLKRLLPRLMEQQVVRPPWLGVSVVTIDSLLVERLELPVNEGIYVTQVTPDSPAEQAGITGSGVDLRGLPTVGGDIITAVDGAKLDSVTDLITEINQHNPGDEITLTIVRSGAEQQVKVTLGQWPEEQQSTDSRLIPQEPPDTFPWFPNQPDQQGPRIPGFPFPELFPSR